ncbi:hypothetical protein [Arachidicoccus ginsenosidimutans]|uniref:hypothetical protein n=1 Tax=Arachidicoccus sp. BS20 TaxID=1850526 RepID=UPI0012E9095C|nr:hypothetical protein [Arachidicoccus sp. BS20]
MKRLLLFATASFFCIPVGAQVDTIIDNSNITLPDVFVGNVNVPVLLHRIQNDSSFYKAFKSLHIVGYTSINNINVLNKDGSAKATYDSRVQQIHQNNCRYDKVLSQHTTGDFFDKKGDYNYMIGELFAGLFFIKDTACGETNIVAGNTFDTKGKSGIDKKKEQLKMLFFNPGKKISGIPFIGNKLDVYDDDAKKKYDYKLDTTIYNGTPAYEFTITPKPGSNGIVIDHMSTVFDANSLEVLERTYSLSYKAGVYDFDVHMKVELQHINGLLLPVSLHYSGNWYVLFKGRERADFTSNLYDFRK